MSEIEPSSPKRINKTGKDAFQDDPVFFRLIANFSGYALIACIIGITTIVLCGKDVPEGLVAIGSGLVGLLTGTFAAKK
jgi:hypothetical protein